MIIIHSTEINFYLLQISVLIKEKNIFRIYSVYLRGLTVLNLWVRTGLVLLSQHLFYVKCVISIYRSNHLEVFYNLSSLVRSSLKTHFMPMFPLFYTPKVTRKPKFSDVCRGYRKGAMARNELKPKLLLKINPKRFRFSKNKPPTYYYYWK